MMKYDFDLSLDQHTSVGKIIAEIKKGSKVLEFGPGNGRMTNYLVNELKCDVSIVEFDPVLFEHVMNTAQNGYLGNIEEYKWVDYFAGQKFDFIIFADVLEHLTNSEEALRRCRDFLSREGEILVTFPNITHNSVLINLFNEKLDWNQYGLLDRTHNSFYTQSGFEDLFSRIDLHIRKEDFTYAQVGQNEIESNYEDLPAIIRYSFKQRPFSEVYQYFYALRKEPVAEPERTIPINSNNNTQIQLAYRIDGKYEIEPYLVNYKTKENLVTEHHAPAETERLRIVVGHFPSTVRISVVSNNQLLPIRNTNADWYQEDLFVFDQIEEEPFITVSGRHVADKDFTVTIEVLNEEEFLPINQLIFKDLADNKKIERLLRAKMDFYDKYHYELSKIPFRNPDEYGDNEDPNINDQIKITVESLENNEVDNELIVKGWAYKIATEEPVDFLLAEGSNDLHVNHLYRPDVNEVFDLMDDVKYGFILTIKDYQITDSFRFLAITRESQVFPITVSLPEKKVVSTASRIRRVLGVIRREGFSQAYKKFQLRKQQSADYEDWMEKIEIPKRVALIEEAKSLEFQPKISLVVPVYNVDEKWLRACVGSLTTQIYQNWELCLADDNSPKPHIKPLLQELAAEDDRIKVVFRSENGHISEATNSALEVATGKYIGFLDNDDILADTALLEVVKALNENPEIEFIYTDEDKLSMSAKRFDPFFKPNWNETLLLGHNYITHFVVVKKNVIDQIGGLRTEFNGSQDYDFVLRATETAREIKHISSMAYHWRTIETSVAMDPQSKEYAYVAGQKAVAAALERRKIKGKVSMTKNYGAYKVDFTYAKEPKVSIIFAKDLTDATVIEKMIELTSWGNFEVIVPTKIAEKIDIDKVIGAENTTKAVEQATGEYLVFLSADLSPTRANWLHEGMNFAQLPDTGIVTGKIISDYDAILNIGVVIDQKNETLIYEQQGLSNKTIGNYFRPTLPREIYSATEDCIIIRKSDYLAVNGFDLSLPKEIMGVDFSLRVYRELNKNIIFDPYFEMIAEQDQRFNVRREEFQKLSEKHSVENLKDPYINFYQFNIGG